MNDNIKYVCPMHPEVTSDKPGKCSICGMNLVKSDKDNASALKTGETHEHHDHMQHHAMMAEDFRKRFFVSLPLTLVVLIFSSQIQQFLNYSINYAYSEIIVFAFASIVVVYGGTPFFKAAFEEIKSKNYGMMTLVSLGISASYLFSIFSTFTFTGKTFYWEASTLVLAFLFGHWLEMRAVVGTGGALKQLAQLIPPSAHLLKSGKGGSDDIVDIKTEELKKGDIVLVKPGEKIPADGIVVSGFSSVNESMITGESKPVGKEKDSEVIGGTINGDGSLTIQITKTGKDSALSQIISLVSKAQMTKPAVQSLADKAANWLTIIAIVVGVSTFVFWNFASPQGFVFALTSAITVIVITCPHALGLAIPTVTTITTSLAAKNGILIRDMKGIDSAKDVDWVVFDKTGTLTAGEFGVAKTRVYGKKYKVQDLLRMAASVEQYSEHPIAKGIVSFAKTKKIAVPKATNFKAIKGKGVRAVVGGARCLVGSAKFMLENNIDVDKKYLKSQSLATQVFVASRKGERNLKLVGVIALGDQIRKESEKAIKQLHNMGLKVAMLTGDKKGVAEVVGKKLGLDEIYAEVLPNEKYSKVRQLQTGGNKVAMIGDGVNDAPALTQADVGIAIGAGTSVAIESAEIVLVNSDPTDVVKVFNLAKKTDVKMKQNLVWATGYNALAIPAAAGVFLPLGISLQPQWGALIMSASSLIVVANALLLRNTNLNG